MIRRLGRPKSTPTTVAASPGQQEDDQEVQVRQADGEVVGGVGAHRHEPAGAERDLAAEADEDVQADGREREDEERDEDRAEQVLAREERHGDEGEREDAAG